MKKRWIGYAVWLLLSACLYFFENNTGTRVILICSLLFPLIPFFRAAFFSDRKLTALRTGKFTRTVQSSRQKKRISDYHRLEGEEPGDLRLYQPGDPVRRIHWKLSAKKDELLIRESAPVQEIREAEQDAAAESLPRKTSWRGPLLWGAVCVIVLCVLLFMLIPEAIRGAQALCNRIFAASEAANAYAYTYFPVPEGQSVTLALALIAAGVLALLSVMVLRRSRFIAFVLLAAVTLFQVYFGLPLPGWINILLYGALALWILPFSADRRAIPGFIGFVLLVALLVALLFPGVDPGTETASERVRDQLSRMAQQWSGPVQELPEGETETRHVHTQSLRPGLREAQTDREYRLVTVEEEQISIPRFINWVKTVLLFLLVAALVALPFTPFLLLNARRKKAEEARRAFASENVSEAVCAIFRQVILWLNETGHDAGNLLYRDWTENLPSAMPPGYAERFRACAGDFEEATYSAHDLPEEKRQRALDLLKETEKALYPMADWKQRLRIRYWVCLCE